MAQAGIIKSITGIVTAQNPQGESRQLQVGDIVYENEMINTDSGASASIELDNGQVINLAENAQALLDQSVAGPVEPSDAVIGEVEALQAALEEGEDITEDEETAAGEEDDGFNYDLAYSPGDQTGGDVGSYLFGTQYDAGADVPPDDPGTVEEETALFFDTVEVFDPIDTTTVTLNDVTVDEAGTITYTASVNNAPQGSFSVTLTNGVVINFADGSLTGESAPQSAQGDDPYVDGESFAVSIAATSGGNYGAVDTTDTALVTIADTIDTTTVTLDDVTVDEAGTITYTASVNNAPQGSFSVTLNNGVVINFADGSLTGESAPQSAQGDDPYVDGESFAVSIASTSGGNYEAVDTTDTALVTINTPTLTLGNVEYLEGTTNAFITATLDHTPETELVVTLSNGATISFGTDYVSGDEIQSSLFNIPVTQHGDPGTQTDTSVIESITVSGTNGGGSFEHLTVIDGSITILDDEPTLTVTGDDAVAVDALAVELDETEGVDRANVDLQETADGNMDDTGPGLAQVITDVGDAQAGGLVALFTMDADYGADGPGTIQGVLNFVGIPQSGLATTLSATDGGLVTLYLENEVIVGRDTNGDQVLTIEIVNDTNGDQQLQTTLYEALDHGRDSNLYDASQALLLSGKNATVQLQYKVTLEDADGDEIVRSDQIDLITQEASMFSFDDDGPEFRNVFDGSIVSIGVPNPSSATGTYYGEFADWNSGSDGFESASVVHDNVELVSQSADQIILNFMEGDLVAGILTLNADGTDSLEDVHRDSAIEFNTISNTVADAGGPIGTYLINLTDSNAFNIEITADDGDNVLNEYDKSSDDTVNTSNVGWGVKGGHGQAVDYHDSLLYKFVDNYTTSDFDGIDDFIFQLSGETGGIDLADITIEVWTDTDGLLTDTITLEKCEFDTNIQISTLNWGDASTDFTPGVDTIYAVKITSVETGGAFRINGIQVGVASETPPDDLDFEDIIVTIQDGDGDTVSQVFNVHIDGEDPYDGDMIIDRLGTNGDDPRTFIDVGYIDGGGGYDTLLVHDTSGTLDFSRISNVEAVDLNEDGTDQDVTLNLDHVLDIVGNGGTLAVSGGDAGDIIRFNDGDTADGETAQWTSLDNGDGSFTFTTVDLSQTVNVVPVDVADNQIQVDGNIDI